MASQRRQGALLSYVLMMLEVLSGLFFTPFLIRSFGQAEYGVYSLVSTITAYLVLLDCGVGNSIVRYMAKYRVNKDEQKQRSLMAVTLIFYTIVGILVVIIGMILKTNFSTVFGKGLTAEQIERAKIMFTVTMLNAAVTLMLAPFSKAVIAFERFTFSKTADIIKIIVRIAVSMLVLFLGGKGIAIVLVNFAMTICFGAATILYHLFKIKVLPSMRHVDKHFVIEIFSYSLIVFVQMIATQLNSMVDQVLMGIMIPSAAVLIGVYAIGAQLVTYLQSFASSINGVLMPGVVHLVETTTDPKRIEKEMARIGRIVFMLLALIYVVFSVFGQAFIILWAGQENAQAYYVGLIIMLPMVLTLSQMMGSQILWALNRHKIQAVLQIAVALANVVFTMVMIKWDPLLGASIATCITYFVGSVLVQNIVFTKYIGVSMPRYYRALFKGILPSLLVTFLVGVAVRLVSPLGGWIGFVIHCGVMVGCYLLLLYTKGMNAYEKGLITELKAKLIKK